VEYVAVGEYVNLIPVPLEELPRGRHAWQPLLSVLLQPRVLNQVYGAVKLVRHAFCAAYYLRIEGCHKQNALSGRPPQFGQVSLPGLKHDMLVHVRAGHVVEGSRFEWECGCITFYEVCQPLGSRSIQDCDLIFGQEFQDDTFAKADIEELQRTGVLSEQFHDICDLSVSLILVERRAKLLFAKPRTERLVLPCLTHDRGKVYRCPALLSRAD
jgi:hypothetical protein